jgi:hypothetical protein
VTREEEALRALERLEREREKLFHATPSSSEDENEPHVILGKRIARILVVAMVVAMIAYFLTGLGG